MGCRKEKNEMSEWYQEIEVHKLSETIYRITNPTKEHMFLIVGKERAVLIDSGGGYGDLPGTIRGITDLPVSLYHTHVHPDHVGGDGFFREAWITEEDRSLIGNAVSWKARKGFMRMVRPDLEEEFDRIPHVELPEDFVWHRISDGDVVPLGGVSLRVIGTPGHTKGSVCFLHEQEQVLFVGDLLARKTTLLARGGTSLSVFMGTLCSLCEMLPELAWIYNSHNEGIIPKEAVWNLLVLCVEILNGEDDRIETSFGGKSGRMGKRMKNPLEREDGKFGNLTYDPDNLCAGS